ncbi:MAG TPA: type II secretion system protein [Candidatus Cybelea sp.]|nr:type II secretion system protein [Candidatus Cybelea sp.]
MKQNRQTHTRQRGFTLIEMMTVLLILGIVSAGLFSVISTAQQRAYSEQVKLDNFQEARDFVDQFFRDINQIGYPSSRMIDPTAAWSPALDTSALLTYTWASPYVNDNRMAVGLVKIDANEIQFEGDMNGDGVIQSVMYQINGSGNCTLCLQRSQADKVIGDTLTGQTKNWGTEVNDVISTPIFTYFQADGTQITVPQDISTLAGAQALASVKTIRVALLIRNNAVLDVKSGQPIETTFQGEVSLNNCSMAASGQTMSC